MVIFWTVHILWICSHYHLSINILFSSGLGGIMGSIERSVRCLNGSSGEFIAKYIFFSLGNFFDRYIGKGILLFQLSSAFLLLFLSQSPPILVM